jgi:hypothetical protein
MYRPEGASSRPEGIAAFTLDRFGMQLESRWQALRLKQQVVKALQVPEVDQRSRYKALLRGSRAQRSTRVSVDHLALAMSYWELAFGCKPDAETAAAASAAASGAIGDLAEPDDGKATVLAALILALGSASVIILGADKPQEEALVSLIDQVWRNVPGVLPPEIVSLVELANQHRPLFSKEKAPSILLHDAGDVLAKTGDRLVVTTGRQELGITEFTRRALSLGESAMEGEDFHFDPEAASLTLSDDFLLRLGVEAGNSFGAWSNVRLREEAARAGILALKCLVLDRDVRIDGERVVPMTLATGSIIAAEGGRMEAVLAARYELDPKPLADQHIRKFREMFTPYEVAGGVSFNDSLLAPFFLRCTGLLTLVVGANRSRVLPDNNYSSPVVDAEVYVDFRDQDPASGSLDALFQPVSAQSLLRVYGLPPVRECLMAMDWQAAQGVTVVWELRSSDVSSSTFFSRILATLPDTISTRILRALGQHKLNTLERKRCKKLEAGLLAQQKIGSLLAINSSEYAV